MGVASWLFVVVWAVGGLGRPGGCVRGRQLAVALASRLCGGGGGGWLPCVGVGDTPACFCFLLVCGGWGLVGASACCVGVACCRGSGVVRPGCLACFSAACFVGGGVWVWVGWL